MVVQACNPSIEKGKQDTVSKKKTNKQTKQSKESGSLPISKARTLCSWEARKTVSLGSASKTCLRSELCSGQLLRRRAACGYWVWALYRKDGQEPFRKLAGPIISLRNMWQFSTQIDSFIKLSGQGFLSTDSEADLIHPPSATSPCRTDDKPTVEYYFVSWNEDEALNSHL